MRTHSGKPIKCCFHPNEMYFTCKHTQLHTHCSRAIQSGVWGEAGCSDVCRFALCLQMAGGQGGTRGKKGAAAQQSQPWQQHTRTHIKSACRPLKAHRLPLIAANWHPASQIKITSAYCTPVLPLTAEAQRGNGLLWRKFKAVVSPTRLFQGSKRPWAKLWRSNINGYIKYKEYINLCGGGKKEKQSSETELY